MSHAEALTASFFDFSKLRPRKFNSQPNEKERVKPPEKSDWQIFEEALRYNGLTFTYGEVYTASGKQTVFYINDPKNPSNTLLRYKIDAGSEPHSYICRPTMSINYLLHDRLTELCSVIMYFNRHITISMSKTSSI